jgi:hypothetical protein
VEVIEIDDVYEDADLFVVLQRLADKYDRAKELEDDEIFARVVHFTGW